MTGMTWAEQELGEASLGDARLSRRLVKLATRLAESPSASIPQACRGWAEMRAAYRFLAQDKLDWQDMLQPRWDASHTSTWRKTLLLVWPFAPYRQLLWPLLTSRSVSPRRPFRHKARSPQVRTHSFSAQPPDLRHFALITRASRSWARSPCSAAPSIRFLFIGSQITLHASFPHSVTLMQLRFTSFVVINLRRDFHPQECAHAGRTHEKGEAAASPFAFPGRTARWA